jgi:MFS family permease
MIARGARALREMYGLTRGLGNLRVLLLSGLLGTLASGLLNPVLPVFLGSRGLDLQGIGFVFTLASVLPIFAQPVLGALSDRFGRKRFVVGLSLGTSLLVPVLGLTANAVALAAVLSLKLLLVRSASPVAGAMVADFAPTKQRATVFALLDSATNLTFVAALVASSAAVRWLAVERVFFLAGALFLAGSLVLFGLREPEAAPRPGAAAPTAAEALRLALRGLLAPLEYVRRFPALGGLFVFQFFFSFALNLYPIYVPLYATRLGAPQAWVGPLIASSWLVFAFVQPVGGRLSDGLARRGGLILSGLAGLVGVSLFMGGVGWLPAPWALPALALTWALMAVPDGLFRPSLPALFAEVCPPGERGRFMGALAACASLAQMVAPVTYGFVAQHASLRAAFFLSSGAFLAALAGMARVRERASSPTSLQPSPEPG